MADRELRRLKRRELLKMLLIECEESERLQKENDRLQEQLDTLRESYDRLKKKLDVKDERLNQKDAQILMLKRENEKMKEEKNDEQTESIAIAEALNQINEVFEDIQKVVEQNVEKQQPAAAKRSFGNGRIAPPGKQTTSHGQIIPMNFSSRQKEEDSTETAKVSGAIYG